MRTRLTSIDFAVGTAFPSIPLTLDYEGTVSCRAIVFSYPNDLRKGPRLRQLQLDGETPVSLIDLGSANSQLV